MKSAVLNYLNGAQMKGEEVNRADIAASFQKAVVDVLVEHTMLAARDYGMTKGSYCRRRSFQRSTSSSGNGRSLYKNDGYKFYRPSPIFCTDNAAMIGVAAYYEYIKGTRHGWDLNAVPNLKLGKITIEDWQGKNTAIVLAAGQGKRMHSKIQKQFLEIQGHPVLCIIPCAVFRTAR